MKQIRDKFGGCHRICTCFTYILIAKEECSWAQASAATFEQRELDIVCDVIVSSGVCDAAINCL